MGKRKKLMLIMLIMNVQYNVNIDIQYLGEHCFEINNEITNHNSYTKLN